MALCKRADLVVAAFTLVVTLISTVSIFIQAIDRLNQSVGPQIRGDVMLGVAIRRAARMQHTRNTLAPGASRVKHAGLPAIVVWAACNSGVGYL